MMFRNPNLKNLDSIPILGLWIRRNWGIIRFCLLFCLYIVLILLMIYVIRKETNLLSLLSIQVAKISNLLLNLLGLNTQSSHSIVFLPEGQIAIDVTYKCTSIIQIGFFTAGVFAYSCKNTKKVIGLIIGIPLIFSTNLIRIVSLFLVGIVASPFFDFAHKVVGEVLMIFITFLAWLIWTKRAGPDNPEV